MKSGVLVTTFSTCRSIAGSLTAPASVNELLAGLPSLGACSAAVLLSCPGTRRRAHEDRDRDRRIVAARGQRVGARARDRRPRRRARPPGAGGCSVGDQPWRFDRVGDGHRPGRRSFPHVADRDRVGAGLPGSQRRRVRLADRQIGHEHAGGRRSRRDRAGDPGRRCLEREVGDVLDRRARLQPGRGDRDLEADRRAPRRRRRASRAATTTWPAGELAGVVAGRVGQRRPVQLDAARGRTTAPAGMRSVNVVPVAPSCAGVLHVHRVGQRVAEARRRGVDGLRSR